MKREYPLGSRFTPALGYSLFTIEQKKEMDAMSRPFDMPYEQKITPVTLLLSSTGKSFELPLDPLVSVSGKNDIVCRNVARYDGETRGSIKEKWRTGDWNITIAGVLIAGEDTSLEQLVSRLRQYIEADSNVEILCPFLRDSYGITRIVVESYDFPFTKGEENQTYTLKCKSDDVRTNLLL